MKQYQDPFYVVSAERAEYSDESNAGRSRDLSAQLKARGLDVLPVAGSFEGRPEQSFLVLAPTHAGSSPGMYVAELAKRYGQDSILYVAADRTAYLLTRGGRYLHDNAQHIGSWRAARAGVDYTAYTRDDTGQTWVIE